MDGRWPIGFSDLLRWFSGVSKLGLPTFAQLAQPFHWRLTHRQRRAPCSGTAHTTKSSSSTSAAPTCLGAASRYVLIAGSLPDLHTSLPTPVSFLKSNNRTAISSPEPFFADHRSEYCSAWVQFPVNSRSGAVIFAVSQETVICNEHWQVALR